MDIKKIIAANLSRWSTGRDDLNTAKKLATKAGIGFGTAQRAKNGSGNLTVENLCLIAKAFKRHPAELLFAENETRGNTQAAAEPTPTITYEQQLVADLFLTLPPAGKKAILGVMRVIADQENEEVASAASPLVRNIDLDSSIDAVRERVANEKKTKTN